MQASDAKTKRQREAWRESKRRNRAKARTRDVQVRTQDAAVRVSDPTAADHDLFGPPRAPKAVPKILKSKENRTRSELEKLAADRRAPASARVTALRTIAEMDGLVGRLQTTAADTSDAPLSTMTREQLENELVRLRANAAQGEA
jgi:hypothetical protein